MMDSVARENRKGRYNEYNDHSNDCYLSYVAYISVNGEITMMYLSYDTALKRYYDTQKLLEQLILEKEVLFAKTQPKAVRVDGEKVTGTATVNAFEEYLIAKEKTQIDVRLHEAKCLLDDRQQLLRIQETELRKSKDTMDRIYTLRILDRKPVYQVARILHYSERQVYRNLRHIYKALKMAQNDS